MTLAHVVARRVRENPAAEALRSPDGAVTYGELWAQCEDVAHMLTARGLACGDRVGVLMPNSSAFIASVYGTWLAGGVVVPLAMTGRAAELVTCLEQGGVRYLLLDGAHAAAGAIAGSLPALQLVPRPPGVRTLGISQPLGQPRDIIPDTVAAILFTSGSTGRARGVMLSHGNMLANSRSIVETLSLKPSDRTLCLLPFNFAFGGSLVHSHLRAGACLVLSPTTPWPNDVLARARSERITGLQGVPSTFAFLQRGNLGAFQLDSLRYIAQAGGAMPASLIRHFTAAWPHATFFRMYGQTEATARIACSATSDLDPNLASTGRAVPGVSLRICGIDGQDMPTGEVGEIWVRGPSVMLGYLDDPDATAAALVDGWLRTGDFGYLDDRGLLYVHGRRSDIVKIGGYRVSTMEVERVLAEHPDVEEAAVIAAGNATLGVVLKAVVQLKAGARPTTRALRKHCRASLPDMRVPKVIEFVAQLPRTPSGKIARAELQ